MATGGIIAAILLGSSTQGPLLPKVPGRVDRHVTQSNIGRTVCSPGYTAKVRPSFSYTQRIKIRQIYTLGYLDTVPQDYEEDHLVPLELGGSPKDERNLWPEPWTQADASDPIEDRLHTLVCTAEMSLSEARKEILIFKRKHG
jgi:hypothetical protein